MLNKLLGRTCVLIGTLLLAACGGGGGDGDGSTGGGNGNIGGGGGGGGTTTPAFSITPTQITATNTVGWTKYVTLKGTMLQAVTSSIYVRIEDPTGSFLPAATVDITSDRSADIGLGINPKLPPGNYQGTLKIFVCKDEKCATQYAGSPAAVPFNLTVEGNKPAAAVTPSSLSLSAVIGEPTTFRFTVTPEPSYHGACCHTYTLTDPQGMLNTALSIVRTDSTSFTLSTAALTYPTTGTYSGTAYLNVCDDARCMDKLPGSPIAVPYTLVVSPEGTLSSLPAPIGLPDWQGQQGGATHNAYLPITLDPSHFKRRWVWTAPLVGQTLNAPAIASGKLFVTSYPFSNDAYLYALNEADGSLAWSHNFGKDALVSAPAAANDRVFVAAATSATSASAMYGFEVATGLNRMQQALTTTLPYFSATLKDGVLYSEVNSGNLSTWNASNGDRQWTTTVWQKSGPAPAVDNQYAYTYVGGELSLLDRSNGKKISSVFDTTLGTDSLNAAVVLTSSNSLALVDSTSNVNSLIRYMRSGTSLRETWRRNGAFGGEPVYKDGNLYVTNTTSIRLDAYNEATGALLWNWRADMEGYSSIENNLIVTNNLVFLTTNSETVALDLATRKIVWTFPFTGRLAISANRVLYIVTRQSKIYAINLF